MFLTDKSTNTLPLRHPSCSPLFLGLLRSKYNMGRDKQLIDTSTLYDTDKGTMYRTLTSPDPVVVDGYIVVTHLKIFTGRRC